MVLLMAVTVVYAPLVLPLLLLGVDVRPREIAKSLDVIMLLPLALGLLARARYPRVADWSSQLGRVSSGGMVLGASALLLVEWRDLLAAVGS